MKQGKQSAVHMKGYIPRPRRRAARMMRGTLQHALNPLHVYCRLVDAGANKAAVRRACAQYERLFYKPILGVLLLGLFMMLSACTSAPIYKPVETMVPVSVPCKAPEVEKPKSSLDTLSPDASIFEKVKMLLIDRELHKGYEAQLEAAVKACS